MKTYNVKLSFKLSLLAGILASFVYSPLASGQVTVALPNGSIPTAAYGEYTAPYYGTVNGVATMLICDDFAADTPVPSSWSANITTPGNRTKFTGQQVTLGTYSTQQAYNAIAYLAVDLIGHPADDTVDTFAIWDIFDKAGVHGDSLIPGVALTQIDNAAINALKNAPAGESGDITIYTPVGCAGKPAGCPPQEFVSVNTPEASSSWILAIDLLTLGPVALFFRRRFSLKAQ